MKEKEKLNSFPFPSLVCPSSIKFVEGVKGLMTETASCFLISFAFLQQSPNSVEVHNVCS